MPASIEQANLSGCPGATLLHAAALASRKVFTHRQLLYTRDSEPLPTLTES